MAVDLVHVGVGVSDDHHAHILRHVLALEHGDHGMPEAMEALLRQLMLTFGVARVYAGLAHDVDELLAIAGSATWLELMDVRQHGVGGLGLIQQVVFLEPVL